MIETLVQLNRKQYALLLTIFFFQIFISSLPSMSAFFILGDLGGGVNTASYGMTFFLLGNISTKSLGPILTKNIGFIKSIKICSWLTFLTFFPVLFVNNYYLYLFFRFLNGFVSGPVFVMVLSFCASYLPQASQAGFIKRYLFLFITAPVVGAVFGGVISYNNYWQTAFFITSVFLFFIALFMEILFPKMETERSPIPIDIFGFILLALTMITLGFCLITGQVIDGFRSLAFNIVFSVGCVCLIGYILWSIRNPDAVLTYSYFKNADFSLIMFQTLWMVIFYFSLLILLPYWLHLYVNYSVSWIAFTSLLVLVGPLVVFATLHLLNSMHTFILTLLSFIMITVIAFFISTFNSEVNLGRIVISRFFLGVSYALFYTLIMFRLMKIAKPKELSNAFCLFAFIRGIASLVGIAYFTTLWQRRTTFYYTRLGGELNGSSDPTQEVLQMLNIFNFSPSMKAESLNIALSKQASSLALQDCCYLIGWIALTVLIVTCIYKLYSLYKPKLLDFISVLTSQ